MMPYDYFRFKISDSRLCFVLVPSYSRWSPDNSKGNKARRTKHQVQSTIFKFEILNLNPLQFLSSRTHDKTMDSHHNPRQHVGQTRKPRKSIAAKPNQRD